MRWPRWASRLTILPPIRPRPMMPISILPSWGLTGLGTPSLDIGIPPGLAGGGDETDHVADARQRAQPIIPHRQHGDTAAVVAQRLQVPRPLGLDQGLEAVARAGDGQVVAPLV